MILSRMIYQFEKWLIITIFVFIFCLSFLQVILRYFFNAGFAWVPEIVVFAFIILTLAAASTGVKSGVHIGVDVIVKLLPVRFQTICYFLTSVAGLALYFFMSYLTYQFVLSFKEMGQVSTITELPVWIMIAYIPVSFFLMGIHYCEALVETYGKYKRGESLETEIKEHI